MFEYEQWTLKNFPSMWKKYIRNEDGKTVPLNSASLRPFGGRYLWLKVPPPLNANDFSALSIACFGTDVGLREMRFDGKGRSPWTKKEYLTYFFSFDLSYNDMRKLPLFKEWESVMGCYDGANPVIHTTFGERGTGGCSRQIYGSIYRKISPENELRLKMFDGTHPIDVTQDARDIVKQALVLKVISEAKTAVKHANPGFNWW